MTTTNVTIKNMTADEVLNALKADSPLSRVRRELSSFVGQQEQAREQRRIISSIEMRREELQAANRILDLFGLALP
jgi:hypothetical protein